MAIWVKSESASEAPIVKKPGEPLRLRDKLGPGWRKDRGLCPFTDSDGSSEDQLKIGMQVEMEHTKTLEWLVKELGGDPGASKDLIKEAAKKIAEDHIAEFSDYYTRLVEMEKKAEAEKKQGGEDATKS